MDISCVRVVHFFAEVNVVVFLVLFVILSILCLVGSIVGDVLALLQRLV